MYDSLLGASVQVDEAVEDVVDLIHFSISTFRIAMIFTYQLQMIDVLIPRSRDVLEAVAFG